MIQFDNETVKHILFLLAVISLLICRKLFIVKFNNKEISKKIGKALLTITVLVIMCWFHEYLIYLIIFADFIVESLALIFSGGGIF